MLRRTWLTESPEARTTEQIAELVKVDPLTYLSKVLQNLRQDCDRPVVTAEG